MVKGLRRTRNSTCTVTFHLAVRCLHHSERFRYFRIVLTSEHVRWFRINPYVTGVFVRKFIHSSLISMCHKAIVGCHFCNRGVGLTTTQHSQIVLGRFCICEVDPNIFSPYKTYQQQINIQ